MLEEWSAYQIWTINLLLIAVWHIIVWKFCVVADASFFSPSKWMYKIRKWENNGAFYTCILKIKKWKDKLPQYTAKGGFSKKNLKSSYKLDRKYIKQFIVETCRGEWDHFVCSLYSVISFVINPLSYAVIFSVMVILGNLPFIAIQRYNRIRLLKIYSKVS